MAGLLLWRGLDDDTYVAPAPEDQPTSTIDSGVASETLRQFEAALVTGDGDAAAALGANDEAAAVLTAAVANAEELDLDDLGFRYLSETDAPMGSGSWSAEVELTWRIDEFDGQAAARAPVVVGFADHGASIASVGSRSGLTPLWLQGPLAIRTGGGALVMAAADVDVAAYHQQARVAVTETRETFGGAPRLVVEVPATMSSLDRTIGSDPGTYDSIAAVTTGADGSVVPGTPLHVFINPEVYGGLDDIAAQVVMTHEAVHVVTEAPFGRSVPLWLLEGFADFVALGDVDLPVERTAAQIIEQVREEGVPDALPTRIDFDTSSGHLGAAYESAWQVCEVLADHGGQDALVAMYDAALAGSDLDAELEQRFGWTEADLLAAWQARLRSLAGVD